MTCSTRKGVVPGLVTLYTVMAPGPGVGTPLADTGSALSTIRVATADDAGLGVDGPEVTDGAGLAVTAGLGDVMPDDVTLLSGCTTAVRGSRATGRVAVAGRRSTD